MWRNGRSKQVLFSGTRTMDGRGNARGSFPRFIVFRAFVFPRSFPPSAEHEKRPEFDHLLVAWLRIVSRGIFHNSGSFPPSIPANEDSS